MKELTIQEKAKAYDEKVSQAKEMLKDGTISQNAINYIQHLFPELKESDDERIRKAIIECFKARGQGSFAGYPMPTVLAWLEKQGKLVEYYEDKLDRCACENFNKGYKTAIEHQKEKQGDKSDNNVKPKFHEGKWLCENKTNNYARFIQILETVNVQGKERYRISRDIHNDEDIVEFDFVEKHYHKFDIQDAKDGDVLITNKKQPFIFNSHYNEDTEYIFAYCGISDFLQDNPFLHCVEGYNVWCTNENVCPATKEQRDLLFQKMKKAGYEWDAEKKELKKIEQKYAEWSEDDSRKIGTLSSIIYDYAFYKDALDENNDLTGEYAELNNWLRFFPERFNLQPKQEWSEEDGKRLQRIIDFLWCNRKGDTDTIYQQEQDVDWLKSLKKQML